MTVYINVISWDSMKTPFFVFWQRQLKKKHDALPYSETSSISDEKMKQIWAVVKDVIGKLQKDERAKNEEYHVT